MQIPAPSETQWTNGAADVLLSARQLYDAGQIVQARTLLETASAHGHAEREALILLSMIYDQQGETTKSATLLQRLLKRFEDDPWILNLLGKVQFALGQTEEAMLNLEKAGNLVDRLSAVIQFNLGAMHHSRHNPSKAKAHFEKALELDPGNATLRAQCQKLSVPPNQTVIETPPVQPTVAATPSLSVQSSQHKQVIFVCDRPRGREAKMAYGLRGAGWQVILFCRQRPNYDLNPFFDMVHYYQNDAQALALAAEYPKVNLFHVFSLLADPAALAYIRYKPGKVIFDPNDIFEGTINQCREYYPLQRYCIEHADALCCRDLQMRHVIRTVGYRPKGQKIFFPEYCWDPSALAGYTERRGHNDDIHVVSIGNFGFESQGEGEWGYLDIARRLTNQGIHFHMYQHWMWEGAGESRKKEAFADYIALASHSPYFHLHPTVPMDRLSYELAQYDFGINVISAKLSGTPLIKYHDAHFENCLSLRNIDYLDAGLPVILTPELRLQRFILKRFGAAVDAYPSLFENTSQQLSAFLTNEAKERIGQGRKAYSIMGNIGRLIEFYDRLG
jgi:tetratricopeptide (TPR) repeat protein